MDQATAEDDAGELLLRLTLYAYGLFGCFPHPAMEPVLAAGGKSPQDLAMDVLTRYYDPHDAGVHWTPGGGSLLAYLQTVLWHDFLDLKRSAAYRRAAPPLESFDCLPGALESPAARAERVEQRARLLQRLQDEPELCELVALQLDPDGWPGYTNRELAARLSTTVAEIENRKKRLLLRLLHIWRQSQAERQPQGVQHGNASPSR